MSQVLVIGQDKRPLDPIHPSRARKLLLPGQAAVYRRILFVLTQSQIPGFRVIPTALASQIDLGRTTGLAVLNKARRLLPPQR
jgi:hypothetical protein